MYFVLFSFFHENKKRYLYFQYEVWTKQPSIKNNFYLGNVDWVQKQLLFREH